MPETLADAKSWDASGPRDPDLSGAGQLAQIKPGQDGEQEPLDKDFPVQLPDGLTEAELLAWAKRRKTSHKSFFAPEQIKIIDQDKMYESLPIAGMQGGSYVPLVNSAVDTDTAKRVTAMFNKLKVVDAIQDYGITQDEENKLLIDDLINQQILVSAARIPEKAYEIMKDEGLHGTTAIKTFWELYDCEETKPITARGISGPIQTGEQKIMVKRGRPNIQGVPLSSCIWDKRLAGRFQDAKYFGHSTFPSMNELLIEQENGIIANVDEIAARESAQKLLEADQETKRRTAVGEGTTTESADGDEGVYQMDEWHGLVAYQAPQLDGTKKWTQANLRFRIINDRTLIKCEENPMGDLIHPFISCRYSILTGRALGNALCQPIKQSQVDVNNLQTSLMKITKKAAQNPTFYERASGLDGRKVFIDELSLIPVNDASKIKTNPVDGVAIQAVSKERGFLIDLARESIAANDQAQSIDNGPAGSATEADIDNQNSGTRFQSIVDQNGWEFFAAIAEHFYWYDQKLAKDGELVVRQSSQDGNPYAIQRSDLQNKYIFVPVTAASVSNQNAMLGRKMALVQQMTQQQMQNPMGMQNPDGSFVRFDIPAFYIKEVMPLMGVKNGRSYLVTTSAQEIAQKAQLNAEMHQPAQGGAPAAPGRPGMPPQGPGAPRAALAHPGLPGVPQGPPAGPPPNGQPQVRLA